MEIFNFLDIPVHNITLNETKEIINGFILNENKCHPIIFLNAYKIHLIKSGHKLTCGTKNGFNY